MAHGEQGAQAPIAVGHPALPVAVDVAGPVGDAVRAWCEGGLGWQIVDGDGSDPVPPMLRLCDHHPGAAALREDGRSRPARVLLLEEGVGAVEAADLARELRPAAVLRWPGDRDRLPEVADRLVVAARDATPAVPCLHVGGSAGGVGTTTVALALGGLKAWSGTPTLVGVRGTGLSLRAVPTAALGAADVWAAADPRPGVDGLRAVRLVDQAAVPEIVDPSVGSLVVDAGVSPDVDVLVCRLDRAGAAALEHTGAAVTVVVGEPLLPDRIVRALLDGRPVVPLAWSARVARAGLRDRVPADLPGSFLAGLRAAATGGAGTPTPRGRRSRAGPVRTRLLGARPG